MTYFVIVIREIGAVVMCFHVPFRESSGLPRHMENRVWLLILPQGKYSGFASTSGKTLRAPSAHPRMFSIGYMSPPQPLGILKTRDVHGLGLDIATNV